MIQCVTLYDISTIISVQLRILTIQQKMAKTSKEKKSDRKEEDGNIYDERFSAAQTRPTFQKRHTGKKHKDSVTSGELLTDSFLSEKIDDRFKGIITDSRFAIGGDIGVADGGVDKYGRKMKSKKIKSEVKEEDPETSDTDGSNDSDNENDKLEKIANQDGEENDQKDDPESRIAYLKALSRGEVDISSSSDDESESDKESDDDSSNSDDSVYGKAGILDPSIKNNRDVELTFDPSRFLAICNLEWSSLRAVDLYTIVSSFVPPGTLKTVKVYESDFGKEQMEKDRTLGPRNIWKKKKNADDLVEADDDSDDGDSSQISVNIAQNEGGSGSEKEHSEYGSSESDAELENSGDDESSQDEEADILEQYNDFDLRPVDDAIDTDFDPEKLRAYEASKLRYYFAVVEFTNSAAADVAYSELDGMEVGHSSAEMDLSAIPEENVAEVIKDRKMRDQASSVPSTYTPPDFVVNALQQTDVKCTWEEGDKERERMLTQYGVSSAAWNAMTEGDDLRAYLASDASSYDDSDEEEKANKTKNMRKMLGLGGDGDNNSFSSDEVDGVEDDDSFFGQRSFSESGEGDSDDEEGTMEMTFIPGKNTLGEKIRNKLKEKDAGVKELTPFEKYKLKRKEKRKERKRQAKRKDELILGGNVESEDDDELVKDSNHKLKVNKTKTTAAELELLLAGDYGKLQLSIIPLDFLTFQPADI